MKNSHHAWQCVPFRLSTTSNYKSIKVKNDQNLWRETSVTLIINNASFLMEITTHTFSRKPTNNIIFIEITTLDVIQLSKQLSFLYKNNSMSYNKRHNKPISHRFFFPKRHDQLSYNTSNYSIIYIWVSKKVDMCEEK